MLRSTRHWLTSGLVSAAALLMALPGCGKDPNLHEDTFLEFPNLLPEVPQQLQSAQATPWTSGRAIATSGDQVFVVDTENGDLVVLDQDTLEIARTIPVGQRPEQVVVSPEGTAFVTVRYGASVARVAPGADEAELFEVGVGPFGIALSEDAETLYVSLSAEDEVVVLKADTMSVVERKTTLNRPRSIALSPNGWLAVTHHADAVLTFRVADSGALYAEQSMELRNASPTDHMFFPERSLNNVANRATGVTIHPVTGQAMVVHTAVNPGTNEDLFAQALGEADQSDDAPAPSTGYGASSRSQTFDVPTRPVEMAVTEITASGSTGRQVAAPPVQDLKTGEPMTHRIANPSDINHHPSWSLALVTGHGSDNVLVLNTAVDDPMSSPVGEIKVGMAPKAVTFSQDGNFAFVLNWHSFTVSKIDLQPFFDMRPAEQKDGQATAGGLFFGAPTDRELIGDIITRHGGELTRPLNLTHAEEAEFGVDRASESVKRGRRVFSHARNGRMSHAGQFACSTCHLEGSQDDLVWMIPEGPRQTPSLAGRLADTAPFNWNGTKGELIDNMEQTVARMGGAGLTQQELVDLENFMVDGLVMPPNPNLSPDGVLTPEQELGKSLFYDPAVGCGTCHAGPAYTDGVNHNVGTETEIEEEVFALQVEMGIDPGAAKPATLNTPTLRGLHDTAPYLHDGSAETLMDVLLLTSDYGKMGNTSHLSLAEKQALVEFLKTL